MNLGLPFTDVGVGQQQQMHAEKTLNMLVIALLYTIVNVNRTTFVVKSQQTLVGPFCAPRKRPNTSEYDL